MWDLDGATIEYKLHEQLFNHSQSNFVLLFGCLSLALSIQIVAFVTQSIDGSGFFRIIQLPRFLLVIAGTFDRNNFCKLIIATVISLKVPTSIEALTDDEFQIARSGEQFVQVLVSDSFILYRHATAVLALFARPSDVPQCLRYEGILGNQLQRNRLISCCG